jgi:pyridoxal phosphate enzyme (YggS family)
MTEEATQKLSEITQRIARAAKIAGRESSEVTLIAVSKTRTAGEIAPLIAVGQRIFGENRVQEAQDKWPALMEANPDIRLHLVGQLQSNKADDAVAMAHVIHAVDRLSLVTALARAMDRSGKRPDCFIQVNLANEPQKGGCEVADLRALLAEAVTANLPLVGLMCVPPADLEPSPWFALLAKLARDHGLPGLSMGMSGDFETAIKIGATHIRVGTALFGERV